jgi:hypothetical protein
MDSYWKLAKTVNGEAAYDKYRDASNYICNFNMLWAAYNGYNIAHGTTSTNDRVAKTLLPGFKKLGYQVDVHVLFANADARQACLEHRLKVQDFYQVTQTDAKGKVAPVFIRLKDAYLQHADTVTMYYNTNTFWLNKSIQESEKTLRKFAVFNRKNSPKVMVYSNNSDVLNMLIADAKNELADLKQQEQVVAMFNTWFNN